MEWEAEKTSGKRLPGKGFAQCEICSFQRNHVMPGPFPARKLTSNLWSCVKRAKKKVDRMYFEVRYAKGCPGLSDNKAMFRYLNTFNFRAGKVRENKRGAKMAYFRALDRANFVSFLSFLSIFFTKNIPKAPLILWDARKLKGARKFILKGCAKIEGAKIKGARKLKY